jgi:hypothetical protein
VQELVGPVASFVTAVTDKRPLDQVQSSASEASSLIILYSPFRMPRELFNSRGPKRVRESVRALRRWRNDQAEPGKLAIISLGKLLRGYLSKATCLR